MSNPWADLLLCIFCFLIAAYSYLRYRGHGVCMPRDLAWAAPTSALQRRTAQLMALKSVAEIAWLILFARHPPDFSSQGLKVILGLILMACATRGLLAFNSIFHAQSDPARGRVLFFYAALIGLLLAAPISFHLPTVFSSNALLICDAVLFGALPLLVWQSSKTEIGRRICTHPLPLFAGLAMILTSSVLWQIGPIKLRCSWHQASSCKQVGEDLERLKTKVSDLSAQKFYRRACDLGDADGCVNLRNIDVKIRRADEDFKYKSRLLGEHLDSCRLGNEHACRDADHLETELGVQFRRAAAIRDSVPALRNIGRCAAGREFAACEWLRKNYRHGLAARGEERRWLGFECELYHKNCDDLATARKKVAELTTFLPEGARRCRSGVDVFDDVRAECFAMVQKNRGALRRKDVAEALRADCHAQDVLGVEFPQLLPCDILWEFDTTVCTADEECIFVQKDCAQQAVRKDYVGKTRLKPRVPRVASSCAAPSFRDKPPVGCVNGFCAIVGPARRWPSVMPGGFLLRLNELSPARP